MVLSMIKWKNKIAVVTGASSGIGKAIVEKLVEEGMVVVGLARRKDRMKEQSKQLVGLPGKFYPLQCDLTIESDILKCFEYVASNLGPIYVLINNAGLLVNTTLAEGNTEDWKKIISVNMIALCITTREAIKSMKINKVDGHIIHINSIAGHYNVNMDNLNVYPATKHGVTSLSDTLRKEFAKTGTKIKVTSLSPGVVATELFNSSGMTHITEGIEKEAIPSLSPEDIADGITYCLSTPPTVNITELIIQPVNEQL